MSLRRLGSLLLLSTLASASQSQQPNPNRPTLFLVGDLPSTPLHNIFDPNLLKLVESPANGQTSRAYINSGAWDQLAAQIKPGDFVLIEFNPDDKTGEGSKDRDAATRTLHGAGDGTFDYLDPGTHKLELIHSYGWYLRKLVVDSINHGANPILCSPPVKPTQSPNDTYADWAKAIATEQRIPYLDLTTAGQALTAPTLRTVLESLKPDPLQPYLVQK